MPKHKAWKELHPKSLDDLYSLLNRISDLQAYVFRGHACSNWEHLTPSIHRMLGNNSDFEQQVMAEAAAIRTFRRHARSLLHASELAYFDRILDGMTLMQHYGAPTRLLDWTLSPWVACYFAAQDAENADKEDAAIWAFNREQLDKANHLNRRSRDFARFRDLASAATVDDWAWAAMRAGPYISTFRYQYANAQMGAQQSLFTISGQLGDDHDLALARSLPEEGQTLKIIIPQSCKTALRPRLFLMNVSPLSLFPSIDGVGRHIREAIQCEFPLGDEGLVWNLVERVTHRRSNERASRTNREEEKHRGRKS